MDSKAVLIVGTFISRGHRAVGQDLALKLAGLGWTTITTSGQANKLRRLADMVSTAWRQRRAYRVAQVDVFSGPAFLWSYVVCALLRRLGKPYVLTLRGGSLPRFAARYRWLVRGLLGSAAAVTTPSNYLLEQMRPYHEALILLPNPLEIQRYPFRQRRQLAPRLVWLRALHALYNPTLAVRVLAQLKDAYPDVQLTLVGPDKGDGSREAVEDLARALGVSDRLTLTGGVPKEDVARQLNRGDIFLNTTHVDNTPVSVTEAMACGLCVVSTNVGGIPYLLDDGQDALLVPPDDVDAMAAAVRRLLQEPALAERLSANGRRKTEGFDWAAVLPQWDHLLKAVAAGNAAGRNERPVPSLNRSS